MIIEVLKVWIIYILVRDFQWKVLITLLPSPKKEGKMKTGVEMEGQHYFGALLWSRRLLQITEQLKCLSQFDGVFCQKCRKSLP